LYLLALGKSHTLDWENKDTLKNLYPQDFECLICMTRHTLFPFCRRSHRRKRSFIALVPEFPLCFSLALSSLSPFATPSPSASLIPQQGGIPLQAGLQATDQPSRESRRRPRPPRSLNAAESCPFYIFITPPSVLKLSYIAVCYIAR